MRIIIILLSVVSIYAYAEAGAPVIKQVPDIRSELKRLSTAELDNNLKQIESINRLPPTSAGTTPSHGCQFARKVLLGKELQFQELQTSFYTRDEYIESVRAINKWNRQVTRACD